MKYFVYILKCADSTYYTGITTDLSRRLKEHNEGNGAKYTHPPTRRPAQMVYWEEAPDRSTAQRREYAIKQLPRQEKEKLIKNER